LCGATRLEGTLKLMVVIGDGIPRSRCSGRDGVVLRDWQRAARVIQLKHFMWHIKKRRDHRSRLLFHSRAASRFRAYFGDPPGGFLADFPPETRAEHRTRKSDGGPLS
jgi:hypothetical protein